MRKNAAKIGHARGSGIYVWLNEQITTLFEDGATLVDQSRSQKQGHTWLIAQLQERSLSNPTASKLLEEFSLRRNIDAVKNTWQRKALELASLESLQNSLEENKPDTYLNKRIEKLRKALSKYQENK